MSYATIVSTPKDVPWEEVDRIMRADNPFLGELLDVTTFRVGVISDDMGHMICDLAAQDLIAYYLVYSN